MPSSSGTLRAFVGKLGAEHKPLLEPPLLVEVVVRMGVDEGVQHKL